MSLNLALSRPAWHARQSGVSLIEVLVAILIVSLGVVSMAGLLAKSAQLGKASEFRAIAALLGADMADRMKANIGGVKASNYNLAPAGLLATAPGNAGKACDQNAMVVSCTATEMAAYDLAQWQQTLFNSIPGGTGYIQFDAVDGNAVDLWLAWQDPGALASGSASVNNVGNAMCPATFQVLSPVPSCIYIRVGL